MFLVSDLWGEYKKRYTAIHGFNLMGGVKPLSGINLDEDEWAMLTFNFTSMKEALGGKKDALKKCLHHLKMLQIWLKCTKPNGT